MTPEMRERLAVLVERRLAGLSSAAETDELSRLLEESAEARELYLRAVEFHVDLGAAPRKRRVVPVRAPRPQARQGFPPAWSIAAALLVVAILVAVWAGKSSEEPERITRAEAPTAVKASPRTAEQPSVKVLVPPPPPEPVPVPVPAPANPVAAGIPPVLIQGVNDGFAAALPGYRSVLAPADLKRLDELLKTKKGSPEDVAWLKSRILNEVLPAFVSESYLIRTRAFEIERTLKDNVAADVIIRKNGTKVEGQILTETGTAVMIKTRFGTASIPLDDIARVEKGNGSATEFPQRFAEAKGNFERLSALLAWCQDRNLRTEKEFTAYQVLLLDASNEKARAAVGLGRPSIDDVVMRVSNPAAGNDDVIANDVVAQNAAFADVIVEMRRRTEGLKAAELPAPPARSASAVGLIRDPLTFDPAQMTAFDAQEISAWWGRLQPEDRREFAKFFGQWCAFQRGRK